MSEKNIKERLDELGARLGAEDFRAGEGLMNEANIRIFAYDPADEMAVRYFVKLVNEDAGKYKGVKTFNLFNVFMDICDEYASVTDIIEEEKYSGSESVLEAIQGFADNKAFVQKMLEQGMNDAEVIILYGVGEVYPIARLHLILSAIQPVRLQKPVVVLYPGEFTGEQVRLFNKLTPSSYYRATANL